MIESAENRHQQVVQELVETSQRRMGDITNEAEDKHREIVREIESKSMTRV